MLKKAYNKNLLILMLLNVLWYRWNCQVVLGDFWIGSYVLEKYTLINAQRKI